jgi:D-xylonolactonase
VKNVEKLAEGYGLVEGPVWDTERGLIFSDVLGGGVFALGHDGRVSTVFEHRRGIGGMVLHEARGLVVSGRNVSFKPFDGGDTVLLLDRDPDNDNVGYNDITADTAGRVYAGSLGNSPVFEDGREPVAGALHLIDLDGTSREVAEGIGLTNGLGFAPDGKTLYHSDSRVQTVWCYEVSDDGTLSPKRPFVKTEHGSPDGLCVAEDGSVWVALAGGNGVAVFGIDGTQRELVEIPQPMCTSVCFGGDDLRDLYVVSGSQGGATNVGAVYRTRVGVAGLPVPPARVRLPG